MKTRTALSGLDDAPADLPSGSPRWVKQLAVSALVIATVGATVAIVADKAFATSGTVPVNTVAMPGAISGWAQTLGDDFQGTTLNTATWATYAGSSNGTPTTFSPSHVAVQNGNLVLRGFQDTGGYETGGVTADHGFGQTYGNFSVRFRMDAGAGYAFAMGLYPVSGSAPPRVTIAQGNAGAASIKSAYTYPSATGTQTVYDSTPVDTTAWNTLGIEWEAGSLIYTLNGTPYATETGSTVPSQPMSLDIQTMVTPSSIKATTPSEVDMDIAWVTAYKSAPVSTPPGSPVGTPPTPTPPPANTVAMPTGNIPGWDQTIADNFTESKVNSSIWNVYNGQPSGDPSDTWVPGDVNVENKELEIQENNVAGAWNSGGMEEMPAYAQTYGKYAVRFRVDAAAGLSYVGLLWPVTGSGPPEVDFLENNGASTSFAAYATNHYRNGAGAAVSEQQQLIIDNSTWQTMGVEWSPGLLTYTLNGKPWGTVVGANVPTVPMELALQTQEWDGSDSNSWENSTNASTPTSSILHIAWVVQYAYDPATAS